jgi:hypothetical protein
MFVFTMSEYRAMTLDQRTELYRWLKSEGLDKKDVVEIRATCEGAMLDLVGYARNAEGKRYLDPVSDQPATWQFQHLAKMPPPIPASLWAQPTTV